MVKIKLNKGFTIVSAEDEALARSHHWWLHHSGYAVTKIRDGQGRRRHICLHQFLLGKKDGFIIDHIDQNKLNNCRNNLRFVTRTGNNSNKFSQKNNTTGYKGVHFHKHNRRFVAYIGKNPRVHLGCFSTAQEAAFAYNQAAKVRFGEFVCLNILDEVITRALQEKLNMSETILSFGSHRKG